jgi:hypothetical protein
MKLSSKVHPQQAVYTRAPRAFCREEPLDGGKKTTSPSRGRPSLRLVCVYNCGVFQGSLPPFHLTPSQG